MLQRNSIAASFPSHTRYKPVKARQGGMGLVFFCEDAITHKNVVLKTFKPETLHDRTNRLRFLQETCDWVFLGAHPNIVQAYRVEVLGHPSQSYLVLEAIEGNLLGDDVSLSNILNTLPNKQLPIRASLRITLNVIRAMIFVSQRIENYVHRDIKPANILLDPNGTARLTDFGLSRSFDDSDIESDTLLKQLDEESIAKFKPAGSPLYIAPEQWSPKLSADCRVDIYALGLILYEMLTGMVRVQAKSYDESKEIHISGELLPIPEKMPEPLVHVLNNSMALDPNQRFNNWLDFEEAVCDCYRLLLNQDPPDAPKTLSTKDIDNQKLKSYLAIAASYQNLGFINTALEYNAAALKLANETKDQQVTFDSLFQASGLFELSGNRNKAIKSLNQCIVISTAIDNKEQQLESLSLLGSLYARQNHFDQAQTILQEALKVADELESPESNVMVRGNIANAHAEAGKYEAAIKEYQTQLVLIEKSNDKINIAKCLGNMAVAQIELGDYVAAISALNTSLDISNELADAFGQAHAMKHLYLAHQAMQETEQTEKWLSSYQAHVIKWQDSKEHKWATKQMTKLKTTKPN